DGQLYIVGFDGWGDYGVKEGCFHRLRYTGRKALLPNKWQAHSNGIVIHFNKELDPKSIRQ
ncbi:MAG: hypothetical protein HRT88_02265, partial [Lentisphaeraceae bacterium]|nr:hypothetical protein [Lentisphaeraceae bacterium]